MLLISAFDKQTLKIFIKFIRQFASLITGERYFFMLQQKSNLMPK